MTFILLAIGDKVSRAAMQWLKSIPLYFWRARCPWMLSVHAPRSLAGVQGTPGITFADLYNFDLRKTTSTFILWNSKVSTFILLTLAELKLGAQPGGYLDPLPVNSSDSPGCWSLYRLSY